MDMTDGGTVLVTNDDGIAADGIAALARLAERYFDEVWVVAPDVENSQVGHRVTTDRLLTVNRLGGRRMSVDGTPADCVRIGIELIGRRPDWVWSGINHGGNLGLHDYYISGTLAAAREAAFFGVPALGASHYMRRGLQLDWEIAAERLGSAVDALVEQPSLAGGEFWGINLPHLEVDAAPAEVAFCHPEAAPLDVQYQSGAAVDSFQYSGTYHDRPRSEGSDVAEVFDRGNIAVTRLSI